MGEGDGWFERPATISRKGAAEAVFDDLRAAIEAGELAVGSRLPAEASLASRYGVSRPVVREALRSTQALGLTQTRTGSGTYVVAAAPAPTYGTYSARDLVEARPFIEVPAAGWAAERRSPEQLAGLVAIADEMDAELDPHAWVELDSRFHSAIAEASGNNLFAKVVADARDALTHQSELINLVAHRREASNAEHRRILDAIDAGDGDGARTRMAEHLSEVAQVLDGLTAARRPRA
ncbi:FadR/GntR family transcriptional regulator [Nocardioides zeae]|uniref:FadR/GntR family transcriptional regulator n=1 Tax=Nocardioides imazamoxiresistens TaxID=3231893 RepID=A0ABU3PVB8_9ACTN|nr:FadR/GntR family transcriptional regulator [Nocardioides zeae]MDT9593161.1 FadR/GntR family transcriptional regulator [Nocardioides zeae]